MALGYIDCASHKEEMCEEKHKRRPEEGSFSQRQTRPKKVVTAQQKGEGRAKQKKRKDEREET